MARPLIRRAEAGDEPWIRACAERAYARYVPLIGQKPAPMIADFACQIAAGQVHVALGDSGPLGFIVFYPQGDHMLLENVAVSPEAAGQGVGGVLIAFCEAQAAGMAGVRLYTNAKMVRNLAIYPRLGYVETGRRQEEGFDRVYFEKSFPPDPR
ncbi:acetyltransferase [Haematobacter missouriensis]|uniref:N-acetyltransferase n=1 Tax=Haematobacter missouriensis TaxID=366616 RepID=A0ABX3ZUY8_9RHOB|nr:GNAT family N-acetyltransferase [Haematobacter missouriensis]KFI32799.1 acetyltransferase [Haematobacter missouriensis]OWJ77443.1 N-acetyltransferase [Haematobacter missouriensis]